MVGHDGRLYQGVPHSVKWGEGLRPPLSQEAWHGGSTHSHHNHTMDGEYSTHSRHDNSSIMDGSAVVGYQHPLREMSCLLGEAASA
jgi:hypothetical protein